MFLYYVARTRSVIVHLGSLKNVKVISSDAFEVGELDDVRYDPFDWNVVGLKVISKKPSFKIGGGTAVMILPERPILNDVMLLSQPIEKIRSLSVPDNNNISVLSSMMSVKVVTKDNELVGTVRDIMIDTEHWTVVSIVVRLDRHAMEMMDLKKWPLSKINVEIRKDIILSTTDMVHLSENISGVRDNMTLLE